MLERLKDGCGVEFLVMYKGLLQKFSLAIFARQNYLTGKWDNYEYGFLSEDQKLYVHSVYTGGTTGFGVSDYSPEPVNNSFLKNRKIIEAKNFIRMQRLAEADANKAQKQKEDHQLKMQEAVKRINKLPKYFPIGIKKLDSFVRFSRDEATFNPARSSNVIGGTIRVEVKRLAIKSWSDDNTKGFWLDNYITKNNKLLYKKFDDQAHWNLGLTDGDNPKAVLAKMYNTFKELEQMVKEAKNG